MIYDNDEDFFLYDGARLSRFTETPCGAHAEFDYGSGMGYRCTKCGAMIGSIGMPRDCYQIMITEQEKEKVWKILSK